MILTRTHLNVRRQGAKKLLGSPQAMHAAILSGFPPGVAPGRPLWRVDSFDPLRPTLYVVSQERPDLVHLEEQAGWPTQSTTMSADYGTLLDALQPGQLWAFRLTANPAHRLTVGAQKKIVSYVRAAEQVKWLFTKGPGLGVNFGQQEEPSFAVVGAEVKNFRRQGAPVTVGTATFSGLLQVEDPERLRIALTQGIGRAKAYGCGLMTLAKPT